MAPTTSSQNGSTPRPGMASRASPGNSNHCRPSTRKSNNAVAMSATHAIGGSGVTKAPTASEIPASTKARARRLLENLRVVEDGVSALLGCLFRFGGDGVMWQAFLLFRSSIGSLNSAAEQASVVTRSRYGYMLSHCSVYNLQRADGSWNGFRCSVNGSILCDRGTDRRRLVSRRRR